MPQEAAALVERAMSESRLEFKLRNAKQSSSVPSTPTAVASTPRPEVRMIDGIGEVSLARMMEIFAKK